MARFASAGLLLAFFALNVYRAITQSFVTDEAYSFRLYVGQEPFNLFHQYDANLHVLHTLATWASVRLFGLSELTFRIPTLIGCALYFAAVYRIASWTTWAAVLLLVANPLIEDHMSAGRGYGLALAFFAWAYAEVLREARAEPIRLTRVAVFLALSVATNLTFLFPASGLIAALMWRRRSLLIESLAGPFGVLTILMLAVPFSHMEPGALYFGAEHLVDSLNVMVNSSIGVHYPTATTLITGAGVLLLACIVTAVRQDRQRLYDNAFFACATFAFTSAGLVVSHELLGMAYPWTRTGLYLLFLVPLCLLPLTRWRVATLALLALGIYMAVQINTTHYQEWSFDSSTRDMVDRIQRNHKPEDGPVRIATTIPMATAFEMYRTMRKLWWITNIDSEGWKSGAPYDYYVLGEHDFELIQTMRLNQLPWPVNQEVKIAVPLDTKP